MSLDESWTFGIFASFDLEVDKVASKNLTLIQVQTTPDQMQFCKITRWVEEQNVRCLFLVSQRTMK